MTRIIVVVVAGTFYEAGGAFARLSVGDGRRAALDVYDEEAVGSTASSDCFGILMRSRW